MKYLIKSEFQLTRNPSALIELLTESFCSSRFSEVFLKQKPYSVYLRLKVEAQDYMTALCLVTACLQQNSLDNLLIQFRPSDEANKTAIAKRLHLSHTAVNKMVKNPDFPVPIFFERMTPFWSWLEVVQYSYNLPPSKTHSIRRETTQREVDRAIAIKAVNQQIRERR